MNGVDEYVQRDDRGFGFRPRPCERSVSDLFSRKRHCRRLGVGRSVVHASISLRPFARQELPRFIARMDALTPGRASVLRVAPRDK
jgi:hypothetical protein